jgi:hypothetical protein
MFSVVKHDHFKPIIIKAPDAHLHIVAHTATVGDTPTVNTFTDPGLTNTIIINDISLVVTASARVGTVDQTVITHMGLAPLTVTDVNCWGWWWYWNWRANVVVVDIVLSEIEFHHETFVTSDTVLFAGRHTCTIGNTRTVVTVADPWYANIHV